MPRAKIKKIEEIAKRARRIPNKKIEKGWFVSLRPLLERVGWVLIGIIIFRIGAHIPVPGINSAKLSALFSSSFGGVLNMFNMFSGGALRRFTLFALGVMPYISASIIIQLLTVVSPHLEELKKEGETGQKKINDYTRKLTLLLAIVQAFGISKMLVSQGIVLYAGFGFYSIAVVSLVAGTMFLVWLGDLLTERGIGNGISLIITSGIIATLPAALMRLFSVLNEGQLQPIVVVFAILFIALILFGVVFFESALRRIPVTYAMRQQGRKLFGSQKSHLPLKLNLSGVIPPIFATSIILFPASIAQWFGHGGNFPFLTSLAGMLQRGPIYILLFSFGILFFSFFYAALVFNPKETADNLRRSGAFVPGIRPGAQTADYIDGVITRLTLFGSLYLVIVCLVPRYLFAAWNLPFYFGGTSLLIVVVVLMDFMSQFQTHLISSRYGSMIKKAKM